MPPNVVDPTGPSVVSEDTKKEKLPPRISAEDGQKSAPIRKISDNERKLRTFTSTMNSVAHILIGAITGISLLFAFNNGLPLSATSIHIILTVVGYQFLMAEAILSLSTSNGWTSHLRLVDKRRAHYILQILGSVLAIAGSSVLYWIKVEHWKTLHSKYGLVALVFTVVSLVNGLTSLWAYELRRFLPGTISKLSHIFFGTFGFLAANISVCYGLNYYFFRVWVSDIGAYACICIIAVFSFIVVLSPAVTFYQKSIGMVKQKL